MIDSTPAPAGSSIGPAIAAEGLTKSYGGLLAVENLDLTIGRGEIFGLVGPNGAGKTTTILMLLGLTEPTAGSARVLGLDPARDSLRIKSRVGYLPDEVGFYDDLTARSNLRYAAELNRVRKSEINVRMDELLESVGLTGHGDQRVGEFSRGMRQRLGIAEALVKRPEILILDEPTVNIDPEGVRELLGLVDQLRTESGITVVLASHLLRQVEQICDRLGIFVGGRMVASGTVEQLAAGIGASPSFEVEVEDHVVETAEAIGRLPGVTAVRPEGMRLIVDATGDVRRAIVDTVTRSGFGLIGLTQRTVDLNVVYHTYFTGAVNDDHIHA